MQPYVNRNRLPPIPHRSYTFNTPLRVRHHVTPRWQTLRRTRSCPPVLPDFHHIEFDFDDPILRRKERAWALQNPEEARQYLIMGSAAASWRAWESYEGWCSGWQEGSPWNSAGGGWSAYGAWAWINRDQDPEFIMTCIDGVAAAMGEEAAWAVAATPWWQRDSGARGSRD